MMPLEENEFASQSVYKNKKISKIIVIRNKRKSTVKQQESEVIATDLHFTKLCITQLHS